MAHDVFISYSHVDKPYADYVCNYIESKGVTCWYAPRDVKYGDKWAEAITTAIESSRIFILILTNQSNLSNQVYKEVNLAVSNKLHVFTLKLESVELQKGLNYYLSDTHWIDADKASLEIYLPPLMTYLQTILNGEENYSDTGIENKLDYYVRVGDYGLAKKALEMGDSPDNPIYVSAEGDTPIHFAARDGNAELLALLLPHSKNFDTPNLKGVTPLMCANSNESAKLLIKKGANVNARDKEGKTPLMYHPDTERLHLLLEAGADVHLKDNEGDTPLHQICWFIGNREGIELLLKYGADINARNNQQETPLGKCTPLQFNTKRFLIEMGGKL